MAMIQGAHPRTVHEKNGALRCPRTCSAGGTNGTNRAVLGYKVPSPDASLGDEDGAERHPYLLKNNVEMRADSSWG